MADEKEGSLSHEEEHKPYVPTAKVLPDLNAKSIILGALFGALFGCANAYLGLRVGLTIGTAIPLAVLAVAVLRFMAPVLGRSNILECNIFQTTGSASSSLASGIIFTVPALFLWHIDPPFAQLVLLALCGGVLGIVIMIPLRKFLIVKERKNLPYPEGYAAANVLIASEEGGTKAKNIFTGLGVGGVYKALLEFLQVWPSKVSIPFPGIKNALIGIEASPALLGVGYILGYRISAIMVAGGMISSLALIPLVSYVGDALPAILAPATEKLISDMTPKEIWKGYIRYIGAGAVAMAGIVTVIKSLPTMVSSFRLAVVGFRNARKAGAKKDVPRTDRDLSGKFIIPAVLLVLGLLALTPFVLGMGGVGLITRIGGALCAAAFAFVFVTVSSRIVGMVGVTSNPTSGMTIAALIGTAGIFYMLGWRGLEGQALVLTVGTVVCISASIAGDISQDLKAGYILGATPRKQQIGELVGAIFSAIPVCAAVYYLGKIYGFGSEALPAPQAMLMKTIIEGMLSGNLPWGLVFTGAAFALMAELCSIPSLPFAVGIYLPFSTMTPVFVGGCLRYFVEKYTKSKELKEERKDKGMLFGAGLIAGEGILGIAIAIYGISFSRLPGGIGVELSALAGQALSFGIFILLAFILVKAVLKK